MANPLHVITWFTTFTVSLGENSITSAVGRADYRRKQTGATWEAESEFCSRRRAESPRRKSCLFGLVGNWPKLKKQGYLWSMSVSYGASIGKSVVKASISNTSTAPMYNKLFTKIVDSSIWLEPTPTRLVWVMMIAVMDEDGFCQFASAANVAHRARLSLDETAEALRVLESPDPNSADPDFGGRRIEKVPGGWMVLNAPKYRDIVTREIARERNRQRVAKCREAKRDVMKRNGDVMDGNGSVTPSEAEAEAEAVPPKTPTGAKAPSAGQEAEELLSYLNEKANKKFRHSQSHLRFIRARLCELGVTSEGCRQMIDRQCSLWLNTPQAEFLRPETLFNSAKFNGYYDNRELPLPPRGGLRGREAEFQRQAEIHTKPSQFRDANGNPV